MKDVGRDSREGDVCVISEPGKSFGKGIDLGAEDTVHEGVDGVVEDCSAKGLVQD